MAALTSPTLTQTMQTRMQDPSVFLYPRVAPTCPVEISHVIDEGEYSFRYYRRDAKNFRATGNFSDQAKLGSEPETIPDRLSDAEGVARPYAAQKVINLTAHANRTPASQRTHEAQLTEDLTRFLLTKREQRLVTYLKSGVFTNGATGSAGTYWDDPTVDPTASIITGVGTIANEGAGQARIFAMGYNVATAIARNPNVRTLNGDARLSVADLADLIRDAIFANSAEMRATGATDFEVWIGQATQDTGGFFGSTVTATSIWSNFAVLLDVPDMGAGSIEIESALYSADPRAAGSRASAGAPTVRVIDNEETDRRLIQGRYSAGLFAPNEAKAYTFTTPVGSPLTP